MRRSSRCGVSDRRGGKGSHIRQSSAPPARQRDDANWVAALRRHGESYREAVIRRAKEAQGQPSNRARPTMPAERQFR
jgi:hypothetical protein